MFLKPFNGADSSPIILALRRGCSPEQIVSVFFRAEMHPVRSLDERQQWLRFQGIVACQPVYDALGISSLGIDVPAKFHYATGLETIGTIANLLTRGGVHEKFVDDLESALAIARDFLDKALLRQYTGAEAYSCRDAWCDWFVGEGILDETILLGNRGDWWLLAVTGTD
jgi:hypothetical protein